MSAASALVEMCRSSGGGGGVGENNNENYNNNNNNNNSSGNNNSGGSSSGSGDDSNNFFRGFVNNTQLDSFNEAYDCLNMNDALLRKGECSVV